MTMDDFVRYLLCKQQWESFQKNLDEMIQKKQEIINEKLAQMNVLAADIRRELGIE
jgi:hypothetical protein